MKSTRRTRLYISTQTPSDRTPATFAALDWLRVAGIRTVGDMPWQCQPLISPVAGRAYPVVRYGELQAGEIRLEMVRTLDAGQSVLRSGWLQPARAYCLEEPDGSRRYFTALIPQMSDGGWSPGSIADHKLTLLLDDLPVIA